MTEGEGKDKKRPLSILPAEDLNMTPEKIMKLEDTDNKSGSEKPEPEPSTLTSEYKKPEFVHVNENPEDPIASPPPAKAPENDGVSFLEHSSELLVKYQNIPLIPSTDEDKDAIQFNVTEYGLGNYEISRMLVPNAGIDWNFSTADGKEGFLKISKGENVDQPVTYELSVKVQDGVMTITVAVEARFWNTMEEDSDLKDVDDNDDQEGVEQFSSEDDFDPIKDLFDYEGDDWV